MFLWEQSDMVINLTHHLYLQKFISQSHTSVTGCSLSLTVEHRQQPQGPWGVTRRWREEGGQVGTRQGTQALKHVRGMVSGTQMSSSSHLHPHRHNLPENTRHTSGRSKSMSSLWGGRGGWRFISLCCAVLSCSVVFDSLRPHWLLCLWDFPGKNTGVGSHSLLQRIFPAQGSNPDLLPCRQILYHLSHLQKNIGNRTLHVPTSEIKHLLPLFAKFVSSLF